MLDREVMTDAAKTLNAPRHRNGKTASPPSEACRPFLKWVGGKGQLLPELTARIPEDIERYFEPFVGGGTLFFRCRPKRATLIDINEELVSAYKVVRDDIEALIKDLRKHK